MIKELTVREVSEKLGYDVKIVKESEKLKLNHGDIVKNSRGLTRIVLKYKGELTGFTETTDFNVNNLNEWAEDFGYKKIGNVFKN